MNNRADENTSHEDVAARIETVRGRIAEIKRRLPKHSTPTVMAIELEELEYTLRQLLAAQEQSDGGTASGLQGKVG